MLYETMVERHLEKDKEILAIEDHMFSYVEIDGIVYQILKYFLDKNIEKDDRILIFADNNMATIFTILACLAGGMVFVLADVQMSEEKALSVFNDSMPKAVLGLSKKQEGEYQGVIRIDKAIEHICCDRDIQDCAVSEKRRKSKRKRIPLHKMTGILYTSGSTGEPRGVISCGHQILYCIKAINRALKHSEYDRVLSVLPLSFDYGLYQVFLALTGRFRIYIQKTRKIQAVVRDIVRLEITGFPGNPTLFRMMLKSRLLARAQIRGLRYMTSTGEVFSEELIKELGDVLPDTWIVPMYGLTECKRVSIMPLDKEWMLDKRGSCGRPLPGVRVYLKDVDQKSRTGELVVEGPNVMDGYWNAPEETARYFSGQADSRKLYTGDIFSIDKDGFLYFKGRIKRIIKLRGYRFGCEEVEALVRKMPDIEACAVFSAQTEGEEYPVVCAVSGEMEQQRYIKERLSAWHPAWKSVAVYVRRANFPRNIHGKVDFNRIQKEWMKYDV